MKKGFKFLLIGIVSIILVSMLKLMGIEKNIVIILYLMVFFWFIYQQFDLLSELIDCFTFKIKVL